MAEDSDEDIFVDFQLRPVNSLTRKEGLLIKKNTLRQAKLLFGKKQNASPSDGDKTFLTNRNCVLPEAVDKVDIPTHTTPVKRIQAKADANVSDLSSPKYRRLSNGKGKIPNENRSPVNTILNYFTRTPSPKKSPMRISVRNDLRLSSPSQEAACESLAKRNVAITLQTVSNEGELDKKSESRIPLIIGNSSSLEIITLSESEDSQDISPKKKENLPRTPVKKALVASDAPKENIILSPGIKKRINRFKSIGKVGDEKKPKFTPRTKLFSTSALPSDLAVDPSANLESLPGPSGLKKLKCLKLPVLDSSQTLTGSSSLSHGAIDDSPYRVASSNPTSVSRSIDRDILGTIFHEVVSHQDYLKKIAQESGQFFESLLSDFDLSVAEKFFCLDLNSQTLFMRMFFRKEGWHRVSSVKYADLSDDLAEEVKVLVEAGLFDNDIEREPLSELLRHLRMAELSKLSKINGISGSANKEAMIGLLLRQAKNQKSVADIFKREDSCSRNGLIKHEVCKMLGPCFQLHSECKESVSLFVLLFSLSHDIDDETKRCSSQRFLLHQVLTRETSFVEYTVVPAVVFEVRADLLVYNSALKLRKEMDEVMANKQHDDFISVASRARQAFVQLLPNIEYRERVARQPTYLRRFNAGSVYASILTSFCENFKRKTDPKEVEDILKLLLEQKTFCVGSRGKWYELMAQNLQTSKKTNEAAEWLLAASKDPLVDEVKRLALQIRTQALLKAKKNKVKDGEMREALEVFSSVMCPEPASIEVSGQALAGGVKGSKLVYVQNTSAGKRYSSVEEEAISYYKTHGFIEGIHCEGFIVSTIFYLLFFDLIYDVKTSGVFLSRYQTRPLDMGSSAFFHNREVELQARFQEMDSWTIRQMRERVEHVFALYGSTSCVITWKDYFSPKLFSDLIDCLGMRAVKAICKRFALKPRQARSGFPDLTLWNVVTKRCKFVEVKSPHDRLAPNQRVWLEYLRENGIDCEVCNVKNVGGKQKMSQ